jgi:hypothetical protein
MSGRLIPLSRLLAASQCESTLDYAEAWALTCMLMQEINTVQIFFLARLAAPSSRAILRQSD